MPITTPSRSALFQKFVTDTSMLPKLEMTGTMKTAAVEE